MDPAEWELLRKQVKECTRCAIRAGCKQTVFGDGNVAATVFLVGEAPGETEDALGLPFIGPAGRKLVECLKEAEFEDDELYIANAVKCRPPGNRTPHRAEIQNCAGFLVRQLEYVKPKIVVAMGAVAAALFVPGKTGVGKLRGQFHRGLGQLVMVTWHPSFILRSEDPLVKCQVIADFKTVKERLAQMKPKEADDAGRPEATVPEEDQGQ